jgi:CRISPR/Cas system-associated protein Cas10 (large subunit of type III CRISPR-Cas system)
MADFTMNMKAFTDRLKSSIDDRGESLTRVHQATTDLLDGARDFLKNVSLEHDARSESVHAFMSNSRANREETVKAMRDSHCESLAAMSAEMHQALNEATKARVEEVNNFMTVSHDHRCETSQAMRDAHREELAAMREELHHTLEEANKSRLEAVGMMRDTFQAARQELAADLGDAAKAWRDFANRRDVSPSTEPSMDEHTHDEKPHKAPRSHTKRKVSHAR